MRDAYKSDIGEVHMNWHLWRRRCVCVCVCVRVCDMNSVSAPLAPIHIYMHLCVVEKRKQEAIHAPFLFSGGGSLGTPYIRTRSNSLFDAFFLVFRYALYENKKQFALIDAPWLSWEFTVEDEHGRAVGTKFV